MIPHKQKYFHDDEAGTSGDCYRTAIACLLERPRDEVPHFYEGCFASTPEAEVHAMHDARREWIRREGLLLVEMALNINDDGSVEGLVASISERNPGQYWMLIGASRNGTGHVVICRDGAIVHDPAIDDSGIVGPEPNSGCYWVEFLARPLTDDETEPAPLVLRA